MEDPTASSLPPAPASPSLSPERALKSAPVAQVPASAKKDTTESADLDWQTGYVWAYITKFQPQMIGKGGLNTVMDLEEGLHVEGHDDVVSYVLQKFLQIMKPAVRDMSDKSMPKHLLRILDASLAFSSISIYHTDIPGKPTDKPRDILGPMSEESSRKEMNPLRRIYQRTRQPGEIGEKDKAGEEHIGSRFWTMDWRDKLAMLRQLVDWQLAHTPSVRDTVKLHYKLGHQKPTDFKKESNPLICEPIGQDRTKKRYWCFDDSARIYTSTNPFKRACPLVPASSTPAEVVSLIARLREDPPPAEPGKVVKPKVLAAEAAIRKKELDVANWLETVQLPKIEKEIQRQQKTMKKAHTAALVQAQIEDRSGRSRRARKNDYANDRDLDDDFINDDPESDSYSVDEGEEDGGASSRRRSGRSGRQTANSSLAAAHEAMIPAEWRGERRSTRVQLKNERMDNESDGGGGGRESRRSSRSAGGPWEDGIASAATSPLADGGLEAEVKVDEQPQAQEEFAMEVTEPETNGHVSPAAAPEETNGTTVEQMQL